MEHSSIQPRYFHLILHLGIKAKYIDGVGSIKRIGVIINTPAQLHFYRNIVKSLRERGNTVFLIVRDYGDTIELLNELNLDYYIYSRPTTSKHGKVLSLPLDILRAYNYLKSLNIDMITGFGVYDAYTAFLLRVPVVVFNDSEPLANMKSYAIQFKLYMPFISVMITPESFRQDMGDKQIKINSYKELAYLHPNYYKSDDSIFDLLGLGRNQDYVLLRFNAFDAVHDFSIKGFSDTDKIKLVMELKEYADVFISSEIGVPDELKGYVTKIPKIRIHDAISHAKLLITDTQTMATEGALLGTPTIRCNTFVGKNDMGNFKELESNYELIFNYTDPNKAICKAVELCNTPYLKKEWGKKKEKILGDKIDVTAFMIWFIENYPRSFAEMKKNPEVQYSYYPVPGDAS